MKKLLALLVALSTLVSVAARAPESEPDRVYLTFGVYQTDKATEMYKKFVPLLEGLQEDMSQRMGVEVDLDMRIFKTYEQGLVALVGGQVDFVRFGPASYVLAKTRNPGIELIAREEKKGKTTSDGVIFTREKSPVKRLEDLQGYSFAFGDENSTIGRYLAQEQLLGAGIRGEDLAAYEYLGRHDTVVRAVQLGDFEAGSAKESTFKKLQDDKHPLRIISRFANVTKPWIARADLPAGHFEALRQTLLECGDKELLAGFKVSGFVMARDEHYGATREAMRVSRNFDSIRETPKDR